MNQTGDIGALQQARSERPVNANRCGNDCDVNLFRSSAETGGGTSRLVETHVP